WGPAAGRAGGDDGVAGRARGAGVSRDSPPGAAGPGPAIEVRPVLPTSPRQRAAAATLGKAVLRAEPRTGTLLWIRDPFFTWAKGRRYRLALPAAGRPRAVTSLCLATYTLRAGFQTFITRRLLLLDPDRRGPPAPPAPAAR